MKKNTQIKIIIFFSVLFIMACQTEEYEVLENEDQNTMTNNAEVYDLVYRSAMYDGSADDEIDESSCFSIQLPFKVTIEGIETSIHSNSGFSSLLDVMDRTNTDIQHLLKFPVMVKTSAHEIIKISSRQEFVNLQQSCANEISISCVQLQFPLNLFVYNINLEESNSKTISNKKQLYNYLTILSDSEILSFDYPVNLIYSNGDTVEVNNNGKLENEMRSCLN